MAGKESDMMEEKTLRAEVEIQRERMLQTINQIIQALDDQKLKNVYYFVLHIR